MRNVPSLDWNRRHNLASLWVSYAHRVWDIRDLDELSLTLGYSATGRLARVLLLDPRRTLPPGATTTEALVIVAGLLAPYIAQADMDVLRSALVRSTEPGSDEPVQATGA